MDLEAHGIEDSSFVIDKRQGVLSGYRLPQQRPCHRAQILSIEYPALRGACVISHQDDTLPRECAMILPMQSALIPAHEIPHRSNPE
jgi:hypothetical protein